MGSFKQLASNDVPARTIYPTAGGGSLGSRSTSASPYSIGDAGSSSATLGPDGATSTGDNADSLTSGGLLGQPVAWWVLLLALLYAVRFAGAKLGNGEEFRNLKVSVFNIVTVSLMAVVGIGFLKVLFNRFKVPGLTPFVNAV